MGILIVLLSSSHDYDSNICLLLVGFPGSSNGKESACNAGDLGLTPGSGRSSGQGNGNPTPVFLPGEFHGQGSLVGYNLWGCRELDMIE